jgi:hypothetical protein
MTALIKPKEIVIKDQDGNDLTFTISKFSAWDGREICTQYPLSAIPKLGDYPRNEELSRKIVSHCGVTINGNLIVLNTKDVARNHIPDWEVLMKLEKETIQYNCSFFLNGSLSTFFGVLAKKIPPLITKMLTDSWAQSSTAAKPASTNSEPSTT